MANSLLQAFGFIFGFLIFFGFLLTLIWGMVSSYEKQAERIDEREASVKAVEAAEKMGEEKEAEERRRRHQRFGFLERNLSLGKGRFAREMFETRDGTLDLRVHPDHLKKKINTIQNFIDSSEIEEKTRQILEQDIVGLEKEYDALLSALKVSKSSSFCSYVCLEADSVQEGDELWIFGSRKEVLKIEKEGEKTLTFQDAQCLQLPDKEKRFFPLAWPLELQKLLVEKEELSVG